MRIRDPIHGTIGVSDEEKVIIDSPFFQRLRHVKQLGFGDLAFPGATHTRHAHSLGALHVASRLFDAVASRTRLPPEVCLRYRSAVRLAALCHDLGHMPLSHATEGIAPLRARLELPPWIAGNRSDPASHEDFTAKLLLQSPLSDLIRAQFKSLNLTPEAIASLIVGSTPDMPVPFSFDGVEWSPLLRAIVAGELDADRMDYLLRDSFYTGVNYGKYDFSWIAGNLNAAVKDGRAYLALSRSAAFAFEDFLLSRYHMFLSVYYHHTTVSFDYMLHRFLKESPGDFQIPVEPDEFVRCDDITLMHALRRSANPWAARIVNRRGYKKLAQFTDRDSAYDLERLSKDLERVGVDYFTVQSEGVLSRYESQAPNLFFLDVSTGKLTDVADYTPLYQRYSGSVRLTRIYVLPEQIDQARKVLNTAMGTRSEG
jgi:HD superfamily phosphohydrolase